MENDKGIWRTVSGRKIFIANGQSLSDAMKSSGKFEFDGSSMSFTKLETTAIKKYTEGLYGYTCNIAQQLVETGKVDYDKILNDNYNVSAMTDSDKNEYLDSIKSYEKDARMLLNKIQMSKQYDTLYRIEHPKGFDFKYDPDKYKDVDYGVTSSPFKEGDEVTWGIRSTSSSEDFAPKVLLGKDKGLDSYKRLNGFAVVYTIKNAKGLDISNVSQYNQKEVLTSGKYIVKDTGTLKLDKKGSRYISVELEAKQ